MKLKVLGKTNKRLYPPEIISWKLKNKVYPFIISYLNSNLLNYEIGWLITLNWTELTAAFLPPKKKINQIFFIHKWIIKDSITISHSDRQEDILKMVWNVV